MEDASRDTLNRDRTKLALTYPGDSTEALDILYQFARNGSDCALEILRDYRPRLVDRAMTCHEFRRRLEGR